MYNIDVRILGEEYREKDFTGKDIVNREIFHYTLINETRSVPTELRQRVNTKEMKNESA